MKFGSVSTTAVFPTSIHRGPLLDNGQTDENPGVVAAGFARPHLASSVQALTIFCDGSAQELAFP
ncbi:hypothetical protein [Mesorhizobium sp. 8]|uniref:hypothetical protein n=1 Tax=Mesorhizobium sp. 8 TaxID=2584466 RepID=UPI001120D65C|nr:hypothetical protein [Mesorhizobium sp. 8]QDC00030.1 hypothetical protein FGU64_06140 [Mesorhizobium sp. 8]